MKKISIITINLNNVDGLRRTCVSVVSQVALQEIEWIVIDGGSTDGSLDVMIEYRDRISYSISEPDKGIYNAMNKGILHAHGDYILFVNSGDVLYDVNVIKRFLDSPIFGKYDYCAGSLASLSNDNSLSISSPPENITLTTILRKGIPHPSTFIRRDRFTNFMYDEKYKIVSDLKFFLQDLIFKSASYSTLNYVISIFDTTGISSSQTELIKKEREQMFKECIPTPIYVDYQKFLFSKSLTERIFRKLSDESIEKKVVAAFAVIVYTPRYVMEKLINIIKQLR